eukprot:12267886-Alexandrium_andersonii.AAC.1
MESLEGWNRPAPVVAEHGVGSRACGPADRPRFLATVPQQFECFTAAGGKRAVRPLNGANAVL